MMPRSQVVTPHPKQILNDAVDVQEALRVIRRSEASHLTLPVSVRLMQDLRTVVRVGSCAGHAKGMRA